MLPRLAGFLLFLTPQLFPQGLQPLCGAPVVNDPAVHVRAWENTLARFPSLRHRGVDDITAPRTTGLEVGAIDTFWVYNFVSDDFDRVPAELQAVGLQSYIWVSLDELANSHVDSAVVATVLEALETRTPAASKDPAEGIVGLNRRYFGDPPNVDSLFAKGGGDGRAHLLLCDIKDDWSSSTGGSYVAGFFYHVDVDGASGFTTNSNRRDLLYVDTYPGIYLDGRREPERALGTVAHELQHLIHWNYDPQEIVFFNEGLSEFSSYVCGYELRPPGDYFLNTGVSFLGWNSQLADYSRAAVWTLYLYEQFGESFIRNFTQDPARSTAGFESAAASSGVSASLSGTVMNFHVANILQDRSAGTAFGYLDTLAVNAKPRLLKNNFGSVTAGSRSDLKSRGADYLRFFAADTIQILVAPSAGSVTVRSIEYRDGQISVVPVMSSVPYQATFEGSSRSELVVVIMNSSTVDVSFDYSTLGKARASAVLELAYDDGTTQYAPNVLFLPNDTAFVWFDGVDGGRIDSVAFWFASTGTARLYVRDANPSYSLAFHPLSGLGGAPRMSGPPVSFAVSDTGFMKTVVDLRAQSISSSRDFVVQLIYDAEAPHPLLRRDTSQAVLRSYLSLQSQPNSGRNMYSSFGDFYMRAYLSPSGELPAPAVPGAFSLEQNYPNPFNPVTTIRYDLPRRTPVRLSVFDLLGREVAVLKDGVEDANRYQVAFDGSRLSSGVYFYRLSTPEFSRTRKMILVR